MTREDTPCRCDVILSSLWWPPARCWATRRTPSPAARRRRPQAEAGSAAPAAEFEQTIRRGVDFLLERQNPNGSWGSANITRPGESGPRAGLASAFRAA